MIAHELRVHVRSVQRSQAAWSEQGEAALRSKGPASLPVLSDALFAVLEAELQKGPAAHGWSDQRWTLSRIKTVIGRRFHTPTPSRGCASCWCATAGPGRCLRAVRSSATNSRSPRG